MRVVYLRSDPGKVNTLVDTSNVRALAVRSLSVSVTGVPMSLGL